MWPTPEKQIISWEAGKQQHMSEITCQQWPVQWSNVYIGRFETTGLYSSFGKWQERISEMKVMSSCWNVHSSGSK